MDKTQAIRQQIGELFKSQNLGVLSTHHGGQPYASLVAFFATEDLSRLFFATPKTTRKFENLKADSRVAILVNSSSNRDEDFHQAVSITVVGHATEVLGSERQPILDQYLKKHPHLEDFVRAPTCALVSVSARSYFVVKNFQNVMELHLSQ